MIASGNSVIEVAKELKFRGANKVYICVTFALFTEGTEVIKQVHQERYFDKLYSTNLSYIPKEIRESDWYFDVDCSFMLSNIINSLHNEESLEPLHHEGQETYKKIRKIKQ